MDENLEIRPAKESEWEDAMALAWRTFKKHVAPDYSEEGINEFVDFISDNGLKKMFLIGEYHLWVAIIDEKIVGLISVRSRTHISLLFVDSKYLKRGIGRQLMYTAAKYIGNNGGENVTVNASPYGVDFYHKIGFVDTEKEKISAGMRITPMNWDIRGLEI